MANQTRVKTAELNKISSRQQVPRRLNAALLDRVPLIQFDLLELPEEYQRRLFDAFHLELRYNRHLHQLTAKVTVYAETVDALRGAMPTLDDVRSRSSDEAGEPCTARVPAQRGPVPGAHAPGTGSHVWRAPGGIRTHTGGGLSSVALPVGLRGRGA